MKIKREPNKRKPIREVDGRKDYSGEASPYWDFINNHQRLTDEGNPVEDTLANPDVLSEDESLYTRPISEDGERQLEAIRETELSPQQQKVVHLCGELGYTLEMAARVLNIEVRTVRTLLKRAVTKIRLTYARNRLTE